MVDRQYVMDNHDQLILNLRLLWAGRRRRSLFDNWTKVKVELCEAGTIKVSNSDSRLLRDVCEGNKCRGCFKDVLFVLT